MAEDHSNEHGGKPSKYRNFDRWWKVMMTMFDNRNKKAKEPIDIWAAVPQVIIKVTLAAELDITLYELWNQFFSGLMGLIGTFAVTKEEVPPARNLDRRLVFTGALSLINLRGLWAMAEDGSLNPDVQLRHLKDGGRCLDHHGREIHGSSVEPEKSDTENKSPSGPEDRHQIPDGKEQPQWPKPAPRNTSTSPSANQSSHTTAGGPAPRRAKPKPRYTRAVLEDKGKKKQEKAPGSSEIEAGKAEKEKEVISSKSEAAKAGIPSRLKNMRVRFAQSSFEGKGAAEGEGGGEGRRERRSMSGKEMI
ncbi:hypothetical protein DL768_007378 [Monosporascus sp. mg162]|nr:hypothetical protein DL768_007378 [Monosporascus sp. mg162]